MRSNTYFGLRRKAWWLTNTTFLAKLVPLLVRSLIGKENQINENFTEGLRASFARYFEFDIAEWRIYISERKDRETTDNANVVSTQCKTGPMLVS